MLKASNCMLKMVFMMVLFSSYNLGFMIKGGDPNTKGEDLRTMVGGHAAKFYGVGMNQI